MAFITFLILPRNVSKSWCKPDHIMQHHDGMPLTDYIYMLLVLNEEERAHASYRLKVDLGSSAEIDADGNVHIQRHTTKQDVIDALTDWPKIVTMVANMLTV